MGVTKRKGEATPRRKSLAGGETKRAYDNSGKCLSYVLRILIYKRIVVGKKEKISTRKSWVTNCANLELILLLSQGAWKEKGEKRRASPKEIQAINPTQTRWKRKRAGRRMD